MCYRNHKKLAFVVLVHFPPPGLQGPDLVLSSTTGPRSARFNGYCKLPRVQEERAMAADSSAGNAWVDSYLDARECCASCAGWTRGPAA